MWLSIALAQDEWEVAVFMISLQFRLLKISSYELIIPKRFPWICTVLTVERFAASGVFVVGAKGRLYGGSAQELLS